MLQYELKTRRPERVFIPKHLIYEPLVANETVMVDGCMQLFKYFAHLPQPFFRLKQHDNAWRWLNRHKITSVVHVKRQDKVREGSSVAPVEYY